MPSLISYFVRSDPTPVTIVNPRSDITAEETVRNSKLQQI